MSSAQWVVGGTQSVRAGGTRLVTSILATQVPKGPARAELIDHLRAHGAEATELGGDAIVAHLGATKALGDEAMRAIDLATRLAQARAGVGVATGRTRIDRSRATGEVVDRAAALSRDAQRGQDAAVVTGCSPRSARSRRLDQHALERHERDAVIAAEAQPFQHVHQLAVGHRAVGAQR